MMDISKQGSPDDIVSIGGEPIKTYDIHTDQIRPMTRADYTRIRMESARGLQLWLAIYPAVDAWKLQHGKDYPTQSPWKDGVPK